MFTSATSTIIFLFAVALTRGQMDENPECRPLQPPGKAGDCCATPKLLDEGGMPDIIKKCHEEAGLKRPSGPPGSGTPPTAEEMAAHRRAHECASECIFKNNNFIKSDGEFDRDAIKATVTKMFTGDWATVALKTTEKCLASAKSEVDASAKCKSGADQVVRCFSRSLFLDCPASAWTESTECAAEKARLTKCPNSMPPPPHHKH